jgi:hypothetical protein
MKRDINLASQGRYMNTATKNERCYFTLFLGGAAKQTP